MSATIITGKLAAATKALDGKTYYVLFEQTYEKNVYPHTPSWDCSYIGPIEGALRRIFLSAASCESGMLRSRNGEILPENFIASWLKELAKPVGFSVPDLELKFGGEYNAIIPTEKQQWALDVLARYGQTEMAERLQKYERLSLTFNEHAAMLSEIFDGDNIGAWRLIKHVPQWPERYAEHGYAPKSAKRVVVNLPKAMSMPNHKYLVSGEDGKWRCAGASWEIVQDYVASYWHTELSEPGAYKVRIKSLREALKSAPEMPSGMMVVVDERVEIDGYAKRTVEEARKLGTPTSTGFTIAMTPAVLQDSSLFWRICGLPRVCTTWEIGKCADEAAEDFASRQMDMFV